ncbi:MAG: glycosyltransferase [Nocardioides sp.]
MPLQHNSGGAGGFHVGLELAVERGADLVWLMDDDGLPDADCLDRLLEHHGELDFWGPAVLAEDDPSRLCFPIRLPGSTRVVHAMSEVVAAARDGLIRGVVIPFNGVLVTRELVERIGLVRHEFFIWGDDVEYLWRAEAAGARIATVVDAHVRHPATDDLGTPMAFGQTTYNHSPSDLKHYCMARNNLVNLRDYRGPLHAAAFVAKTVWFYTITRPSRSRLGLSARAMLAGLRGDFTGHRRFLGSPAAAAAADPPTRSPGPGDSVAVVVVTYNRADLLAGMLDALAAQTHAPDAVIVIDNASTDHTQQVLAQERGLPLQVVTEPENTGGSGGFHHGLGLAFEQGYDRMWLMDDDVLPAPDCLETLLRYPESCLMAVREDRHGHLVEKSAVDFDLRNPLALRPKRASVEGSYGSRAALPELVELHVVAFEGFLVHRGVVATIGLPDRSYFIFYDDADFAIRARRAGYRIWGVRDAVLVRQLDFDQQLALDTWKGFYMYRNLFAVHFRYGENALVRAKPYLITAGVVALSPLRGGRREAGNVIRAITAARGMRSMRGLAASPR